MASQTTNNSNESDSKNSNNKTHSVNHSTNETSNGKVNITTIDIPEMKVHVMESKFGSKNSSKRDSKNSSKRSSPGNSPFPSPLSGSRFTSFIPIINPAQTGARGELTSNEICLFVRFLKIGHIDTKNQRFVAHIEIVARWKPVYSTLFSEFVVENRDKVIIPESEDNVEQVRRILPKINVNNLEAIISDRVHYKLKPYPCPNTGASTRPIHMRSIDVAYVEMFRTLKGVFFEYLELEDFPFDVQDICVRFTLDPSCAHYFKLKVAPPGTPAGLLDTHTIFQDAQEWDLSLMAVNGENNVDALGARAASDPPSPDHELVVRTNVRRKSAYHLYNCFLVMAFFAVMSYCNFVNHPDNVQFRLAGGLTLVLTAVAYKLMLSNTLPTISYLTLVDKYVLTQIFLLTVLVVGFAILHLFYRHFKYTIDFTIEPVNCSQMFHYWAPEDSCELQAFANFTDLLTIGVHGSMQLISSLYFMAVAFQKVFFGSIKSSLSRKSATSLMQQEQHYKQFLRECKELRDRMWKQNIILPAPSHTYNSVRGTGKATMTHLTVGDRNGGTGLGFMGGSLTNIMDSRMHNPGRHSTLNYSSNQLKNSDKHKFVQED